MNDQLFSSSFTLLYLKKKKITLAHLFCHRQGLASSVVAAGPNVVRKLVDSELTISKLETAANFPGLALALEPSRGRRHTWGGPPAHSLCPSFLARARPPAALMDPLNLSWYDDDPESRNWSRPFNGSEGKVGKPHYNYYAMLLTLLIFVIVFGNVLVCMAVSREKALQTTTNYLIVSLAVADLLVATLVMPWVVYLEVGPPWLPPTSCLVPSPLAWPLPPLWAQFFSG